MIYSVRILRRAQEDISEIAAYWGKEASGQAVAIVDRILIAIESLAKHPARGAQPRNAVLRAREYRFLVTDPYLIFYRIRGRTVRIYRVLHANRAYQGLL